MVKIHNKISNSGKYIKLRYIVVQIIKSGLTVNYLVTYM